MSDLEPETETPKSVGGRLRMARRAAELSPRQVALHLGQSNTVQMSRWESPDGPVPAPNTLATLARLYGTTVDWLVSGTGQAPINKSVSRGTSDSVPRTWEDAIRRVRAIAKRLEADLHEKPGANESDFDALRTALVTEDTVRMFQEGYATRDTVDLVNAFVHYRSFTEALKATLFDRIDAREHGDDE